MSYLYVLCEGPTEQEFVIQVLMRHLEARGTYCHAELFGKQCKHDTPSAPGGIFKYEPVYKNITAALRQHKEGYVTTMMDFYAFPQDFPGYDELARRVVGETQ
ncbi:MAG: DUF4276 family protein [Capsulimonadaceae bacterium]